MSGYIERAANQIADILMREGLDYTQTKAVFKQARTKAGLHAPKESRGSPARLTLEEELCFIDQICKTLGISRPTFYRYLALPDVAAKRPA